MQLLPVGPWVRGFPKLQAMCLPGPYSDIRAFSGPTPSLKGSDHSRHQIRATAVLLVGVRGFSTGPCLLGTETMASWTRPLLHSYLPPQCWHRLPRAVVHSEAVFCPPCPSVCTQRGTNRAMGPRPAWSSGTHPRRSPRHPQASLPSSPSRSQDGQSQVHWPYLPCLAVRPRDPSPDSLCPLSPPKTPLPDNLDTDNLAGAALNLCDWCPEAR